MEHGDSECEGEQSQRKISIKIEVEEAPQSAAYSDIEINFNYIKKEPGSADLVKSEPGLSMKKEAAEDGWQDIDVQHSVQAASTPAIVAGMNVSAGDADLRGVLKIKEEPGAIEIGPTVLQHAVTQGRTNQLDMSVVKQENSIDNDDIDRIQCSREKEITTAEWRDAHHSMQETQPEQRAQSCVTVQYRCDQCAKTYKSSSTLYAHCKRVHGTGSHKCTECNLEYKCKEYLVAHVSNVHSKRQYECTICKKMCKSKQALYNHIAYCHRPRPTDAQQSKEESQAEQRAQSRPYKCDKCAKRYKCSSTLHTHCKREHGTGSYKCNACKLDFKCKEYLVSHVQNLHSKEHYECTVCKEMFKSKGALRDHIASCHGPIDAQQSKEETQPEQGALSMPYRCDKCAKTYKCKSAFTTHCKRAHGTGSHKCTECNLIFKCKDYLVAHVTNLHSKRRYECTTCKKMCKSMRALRCHIPHCPGTRIYQLSTCSYFGKGLKSKQNCPKREDSGKCTRPTGSDPNAVASTSTQQHNVVLVKEEPADGELVLGPVVFQHMDCNYRPYKEEQ